MVVSAITKKPTEKWWEGKKKGVMKGEKKKKIPATPLLSKPLLWWFTSQHWGVDFSWRALQHEHPTAKNNPVNQI